MKGGMEGGREEGLGGISDHFVAMQCLRRTITVAQKQVRWTCAFTVVYM